MDTRIFLKAQQKTVEYKEENGYAVIKREFSDGDNIEMEYSVPIVKYKAHPYVEADMGRVAVKYGPVLYCAEGIDNLADNFETLDFTLSDKARLSLEKDGNIITESDDGKK